MVNIILKLTSKLDSFNYWVGMQKVKWSDVLTEKANELFVEYQMHVNGFTKNMKEVVLCLMYQDFWKIWIQYCIG